MRTGRGERIEVTGAGAVTRITLDRTDRQNAIDPVLLAELSAALDTAADDPDCRLVVLAARGPVHCAGMDVAAAGAGSAAADGRPFLDLLRRLAEHPKVVASVVDGRVLGGGVGLVAASDFVFAGPASTFALPEMLWGLLPCCVLPFLIRRCGARAARTMTLSTQPVDAATALRTGLVDQVVEDGEVPVRSLGYRLSKVDSSTVLAAKRFLGALSPLDAATEQLVLAEFAGVMASAVAVERMGGFAAGQLAPWESGGAGQPAPWESGGAG